MNSTAKSRAILIGSVALVALAGTLIWRAQAVTEPGSADAGGLALSDAQPAGMSSREQGLLDENEELRRRLADAEARAARTAKQTDPSGDSGAAEANAEPETTAAMTARFADDKYGAALAGVDWDVVGTAMKGMVPLAEQLAEALRNGETPLEIAGRFQQFNGQLVAQLQPLMDGEVPGFGPNGTFTHPLVVANQLDQVLAAGDAPLSEEQAERLKAITDHYLAQDENLRVSAEGHDLSLQTILEETEMKARFREEIEQFLSAEQRTMLYPETVKDYNGLDLFGTGLIWAQVAKPARVDGPDDLASKNHARFTQGLELSEDQQQRLRPLLEGWARSYPADYWQQKADALEGQGMLKTSRTRIAAERQLALFQSMLTGLGLTPEQREKLIQNNGVMVPVVR